MPDADGRATLGRQLQELRHLAGLTQELLAERAGVGFRTVQRIEAGGARPSRQTLERLVGALSLSGEQLAAFRGLALPSPRRRERSSASSHQRVIASPPVHNLTFSLTSFVGREREITEVERLLREQRLVTLTGSGGCGKSRLALQVARDTLGSYPDGVWLIELASLSLAELVPQAVAHAMALRLPHDQAVRDVLTSYLKQKRCLIVLDNCEHLVNTCARLVEWLLQSCPEVLVLATSRELLGVPGELAYRVPSLGLPEEDPPHDLMQLAASESIRLFLERARQVQLGFTLTPQNAATLVEICRRLDGIPLAIELAAARIGGLTPEEIASRLDDRFRLLSSGNRTALPRQRTLKAAVDWSHDLLDESERTLLRRLSVFAGGWTLEAAEAVCGDLPPGDPGWEAIDHGQGVPAAAQGDVDRLSVTVSAYAVDSVLEILLQLVRKSLVLAESSGGTTRYRLLETIRQYAWDRLRASGETEAIRRAHARWVLSVAAAARPGMEGARHREYLDRLEPERDNVRAALRYFEGAGDPASGLQVAVDLFEFWLHRGPFGEAQSWLRTFLSFASTKGTVLGVEATSRLATFTRVILGAVASRPIAEESLRQAQALGDPWGLAMALFSLGGAQDKPGEFRRLIAEALELFRKVGHEWMVAVCLRRLGWAALRSGDLMLARTRLEESADVFKRRGSLTQLGMSLESLARIARLQGDLSTSWARYEECLRCLEEAAELSFVSFATGGKATVLRLRGEYERARSLALAALEQGESPGAQHRPAWALEELGLIASAQCDFDLARNYLEASLGRSSQSRETPESSGATASLGLIARAEGDYATARRLLTESLAKQRELGARYSVAACLGNLGVVDLCEGRLEEAEDGFRESLTLRREMCDRGGVATLLESFAAVGALRGQSERALRLAGAGARIREEIENLAPPVWRRQRDPWLARARDALDTGRAAVSWAEGQAMTLEQAVEYALRDDEATR